MSDIAYCSFNRDGIREIFADYCIRNTCANAGQGTGICMTVCIESWFTPCSDSPAADSCVSSVDDFSWSDAYSGFKDAADILWVIFACFCLVKLLNMAK